MNTSEIEKNRRYNIASTVRKAINAQKLLGHDALLCSAILSRRGKRLNSIDRSASGNFTRLMHQYVQAETPDKLRVEIRGDEDLLLWSKTFSFEIEAPEVVTSSNFQGLGEAEVNDLLDEKIAAMRKEEELDALREDNETLTRENEQLQRKLGEVEEVVEAKKKMEYYANILGLAFPGLAKMLSTTPLGGTLGALAGLDHEDDSSDDPEEKSQREIIIDLATEFMSSLDDAALGQLYLVFIELSNNPSLIGSLLSKLTSPSEQNNQA